MKKIVSLLFLFLGIGSGLVLAQYVIPEANQKIPSGGTASETVDGIQPTETVPGKPVSISIPKLNLVDVVVEHVGMNEVGEMDVPSNDDNVAWFDIGYRPGTKGNAVIAGHFDKSTGEPAVFYNLNSLEVGDEYTLKGEDGMVQTFKVTDKVPYPYDAFPTASVFGNSNKRILNLITCDGSWDPVTQNYSNRLVIFSELVE
jgi:LPXTG-site transpeptidase (sortase) family protein